MSEDSDNHDIATYPNASISMTTPHFVTLVILLLAILVVVALCLRAVLTLNDKGISSALDEQLSRGRIEAQQTNETLRSSLMQTGKSLVNQVDTLGRNQKERLQEVKDELKELTRTNREDLERIRNKLDDKLTQLQENNDKKLEKMRETVDEKLQSTLKERLSESFEQVSKNLQHVHEGLVEMKNLASDVGSLKRVLTNVKDRGTWGEYQLAAILEQILSPEQYQKNVSPKNSRDVVEFAVKLPGKDGLENGHVWLPVDSKFPKEDYERLVDASERADVEGVKTATKSFVSGIKLAAKGIGEKYLDPPSTTNFGIMFLPTEGLYAEVLRQPGLHDELQRKHRVLVTGPTTLAAILNSLRVGFETLAIEKRSSEVWNVLSAVKTEFSKFGDMLTKLKKNLKTAANTVEEGQRRSRAMERKLRTVEKLPDPEATNLLGLSDHELEPSDFDSSSDDENDS